MDEGIKYSTAHANPVKFTLRERQIIGELNAARQIREIAAALHLAPNTVKSYVKSIYAKAEVHSARELMLKLSSGGIPGDERVNTLSRMLAESDSAQLHAAALAMLRAWTGARKAFCWEIHPQEPRLSPGAPSGRGETVNVSARLECAEEHWGSPQPGTRRGPQRRERGAALAPGATGAAPVPSERRAQPRLKGTGNAPPAARLDPVPISEDAVRRLLSEQRGAKPRSQDPGSIAADGPVLLAADEASRHALLRSVSNRPVQGQVILAVLRIQRRKWLVALADPPGGAFQDGALKITKVLVPLAARHAESFEVNRTYAAAAPGPAPIDNAARPKAQPGARAEFSPRP